MKNRLFIITGILLLAVLALIVHSYTSEQDKKSRRSPIVGFNNTWKYETAGLTAKDEKKYGLRLAKETLPAEFKVDEILAKTDAGSRIIRYPDKLPILGVERKQLTQKDMTKLFKNTAIDILGDHESAGSSGRSLSPFTYTKWPIAGDLRGSVSVDNYEDIVFIRNPQRYPNTHDERDMTLYQLQQKADTFIQKYGGIPDDAEINAIDSWPHGFSPSKYRSPGDDSSYATISYWHKYKGIPVNDDVISVTLNHGLGGYERRWHTLTAGPELRIISPRMAIKYSILANMYRTSKKIPIVSKNIRLVYYDPKLCVKRRGPAAPEQTGFRPAWIIEQHEGAAAFLVDAYEGTVYEWSIGGFGYHSHNMYSLCN